VTVRHPVVFLVDVERPTAARIGDLLGYDRATLLAAASGPAPARA